MSLSRLSSLRAPVRINQLSASQLRALQTALNRLAYPVGEIDGRFGPRTRSAWAEFVDDHTRGHPALIGPEAVAALAERVEALSPDRARDFASREGTIRALTDECRAQELGLKTQIAYVLATTAWETRQTFRPVKEAFWLSEAWRKANLRYYPYYGRGYVQLTWKKNYRKYSNILGVDLVGTPDRAEQPEIAAFILVHGFKSGTFTGRTLADYVNGDRSDFINARRCINGLDKAEEIAALARQFLATL